MTKLYKMVVKNPKMTSDYGYRIHPITKKKTFHYGVDLVSSDRDHNLYAVADGYVQAVRTGQDKSKTGYGNYIWVRYPKYNLSFMYAHCKEIKLRKGSTVKKGTVVAIMGSTGASTGTHLHLGITKIGSNTWLDPKNFDDEDVKFNLTRLLKVGSKGSDVTKLQKALSISADGIFGPNTKNAVIKYQKSKGIFADGIVGKNTAHKLGWLYNGK